MGFVSVAQAARSTLIPLSTTGRGRGRIDWYTILPALFRLVLYTGNGTDQGVKIRDRELNTT